MADAALRQLDRDLPRLDMYSPELRRRLRKAGAPREPASPKPERAKPRSVDPGRLLRQARELMALAAADRATAGEALAEARAQAAAIVAEAEATARVVLAAGPAMPSVASIQKAVADRYGIGMSALLGPGTARHLVAARYEAIRQAHAARPDLSSPQLGRLFRRDHSVILRALKHAGGRDRIRWGETR